MLYINSLGGEKIDCYVFYLLKNKGSNITILIILCLILKLFARLDKMWKKTIDN